MSERELREKLKKEKEVKEKEKKEREVRSQVAVGVLLGLSCLLTGWFVTVP